MLTRMALSRGTKIALSMLIAVIVALLVWALLSGSPGANTPSNSSGSRAAGPAPDGKAGAGGAVKTPGEVPAETLRQRSLR